MSVNQLLANIKNPSDEFTPYPFWFFNDEPDKNRIKEQLQDFVAKGVNGFVLHPRIGIPHSLEYLSKQYFTVVRYIVATAKELGMKVILYDEAMYPSGSAHGLVVKSNAEYAAKGIKILKEPGEDKIIAVLPDNRYLTYGFTGGTIRGIHFGEDDGEKDAPKAADILNREAVKEFIRLTHDRYYDALKEYFGDTVIGFFTDEPSETGRECNGRKPWYDGMEKDIEYRGGDLLELTALFNKENNKTTAIYHKLIKHHLADTFYKPLSEWCEEHGISFVGHPAESDDLEEQKYFHIPGQDLIMRREEPLAGGIYEKDSIHPKLCADIARHMGRKRNLNECFGVCNRKESSWYFTGQDMKWYINWLGMRGTNLFIPHAFFYSIEGKRKEERPPDVGPHNIWWKHYKLFSNYIKRLSYIRTDSINPVSVAVLCDNNEVPDEQVICLYENQIDFHYLPVALLSKCKILHNKLILNENAYDIVINLMDKDYPTFLSPMKEVYNNIELFKANYIDNKVNYNKISTVTLGKSHKDIRAVHLIRDGVHMYLLSNEGKEIITTSLSIHDNENYIIMDLWDCNYNYWDREQNITIVPCEVLLLIQDSYKKVSVMPVTENNEVDLTDRLTLKSKKNNIAKYSCTYNAKSSSGNETFVVNGEEMAECYCNGEYVGVSFYEPHKFYVGDYLYEGNNKIEMIMTGNIANVFDNANLFYGLKGKDNE